MVYLDYSATTPVNPEVLKTFDRVCNTYIGNPNSLHRLGLESKHLIQEATNQILQLLALADHEIIYTSGSSEANNLAIKGICLKYPNRGKEIITTPLEHSSILEPLHFLEQFGYQVKYVNLLADGTVDLDDLKEKMTDQTILVSIASVSSETGILQPIGEIGQYIRTYPKCFFHVDMTQSMGKVPVSLQYVDLASFSAHKFYGLKGIGCLVKLRKIELEPLIHGGESTTLYRSGTPAVALIASLAKALRLALVDMDSKLIQVTQKQQALWQFLKQYEAVEINSTSQSIPHILNFSLKGVKPETFLHALEDDEIYLSTKSACSIHQVTSASVLALTHDQARAQTSLRISLSHLTTEEELKQFQQAFAKNYKRFIDGANVS